MTAKSFIMAGLASQISQMGAEGRLAQPPRLSPGERWYVATTLPRKEQVAEANLERQHYRSFLPRLLVTRRHANRFKTELAPLFPRYIFVILNLERQRWRSVNGTLGIDRLISDGAFPQAVAPGIVETLIQSSDQRGALVFQTGELVIGERVRLLAGPFANAFGTLQRLDGAGRVQLLLDLLGKQVKLSVPRDCVALAHQTLLALRGELDCIGAAHGRFTQMAVAWPAGLQSNAEVWMMLQQPKPDDYVLATGEAHNVRSFVEKAFHKVGINIEWRGVGVDERGVDTACGRVLVEVDPRYFRPTEFDLLIGDPTKANRKLGWHHETKLDELIAEMVREDLKVISMTVSTAHSMKGFAHA